MSDDERYNPYMLSTFAMIPNWLMRRPELTPSSKLVYARLCQYAGKNGTAYPSQQRISEETALSERQVRRCIKELVEVKLLCSVRNGKKMHNNYSFPKHPWMNADPFEKLDLSDEPKFSTDTPNKLSKRSSKSDRTICPVTPKSEPGDRTSMSGPYKEISIFLLLLLKKNKQKKEKRIRSDFQLRKTHFDKFWKAYPVKVGKAKCLKIFQRLKPFPDQELTETQFLAKILTSLEEQKKFRERASKRNEDLEMRDRLFVPNWKNPSTWLNGGCWEDEMDWGLLKDHESPKSSLRPKKRPSSPMSGVWEEIADDMKRRSDNEEAILRKDEGLLQDDIC